MSMMLKEKKLKKNVGLKNLLGCKTIWLEY